MAGEPTPVLSAHLALAVVAYPLFAAAIVGLHPGDRPRPHAGLPLGRLAGDHRRRWRTAPAAPLVVALGLRQFGILFPMVMLLALWLVLAALWPPRRAAAGAGIAEAAAAGT